MLKFHDLTFQDRDWMEPLFRRSDFRSQEYSFSFTYIWRNVFCYRVSLLGDCLIIKSEREGRPPSYLFPVGGGDLPEVVDALRQDARQHGHGLLFHSVIEEQAARLEALFPGKFDFIPTPDYRDYIYDAESLITLAGKKLHAKRNHINRFKEQFPDWRYEPITNENLPEVIAMNDQWLLLHEERSKTFFQEATSVRTAINDFTELRLDGGMIRTGGPEDRIAAFSMGDKLNSDTYLIHIEKAFGDIQGAYAIINQEFARHNCQGFRYIDREDDSGQEGLRKAKQSYRPLPMTEKYAAKLVD